MAVTLAFALAGAWNVYRLRYPARLAPGEPVIPPDEPIPVGLRGHQPMLAEVVAAPVATDEPPRIVSVTLSPRKTSYRSVVNFLG